MFGLRAARQKTRKYFKGHLSFSFTPNLAMLWWCDGGKGHPPFQSFHVIWTCVWETWEASSCHWWESHIYFIMWRHMKRLTSRQEIKLHAEIGLKGFFFDLAGSRSKSNCWDDTTLETDQLFKEAICYCQCFKNK